MDEVADRHAARLDAARVDAADPVRAGRLPERARRRHRPRPRGQDAAHRVRRRRAPARRSARCRWRWLAAVVVGVALSMLHGYACVSHRGDQVVMGMAITMTAAGLTVVLGIAWFQQGGQTPPLPDAVRLAPLVQRAGRLAARRAAGRPDASAIGLLGHNVLVYVALAAGAGGVVAAVPHALRPAPARGRREPGDGRRRRRLGAGAALRGAGAQRRAVRAGRLLPGAGAEPGVHSAT